MVRWAIKNDKKENYENDWNDEQTGFYQFLIVPIVILHSIPTLAKCQL